MNRFVAACALMVLMSCSSMDEGRVPVGVHAPETRFILLDGTAVLLSELKGRPSIIMFWASNCPHSRRVIVRVNELAKRYRAIRFLAVNVDPADQLEAVKYMIRSKGLDAMKHAFSGNDIHDEAYVAFDVGELPTLLVLGADGKILGRGTSEKVVERVLKQPPI